MTKVISIILGRKRFDAQLGLAEYHRRLDGLSYQQVMEYVQWLETRGREACLNSLEDHLEERRKASGRVFAAWPLASVCPRYQYRAQGATFG